MQRIGAESGLEQERLRKPILGTNGGRDRRFA
jgi:hypothetical protein